MQLNRYQQILFYELKCYIQCSRSEFALLIVMEEHKMYKTNLNQTKLSAEKPMKLCYITADSVAPDHLDLYGASPNTPFLVTRTVNRGDYFTTEAICLFRLSFLHIEELFSD